MKKILAISIAAYNSAQYIEKCLDSITKSRYIEDLEVFVVNDGSIDNTEEIIKIYQKKYPRSIILYSKKNEGWGSSVNYSIKHATAKYFKLLDADDWVDTEALDLLINNLYVYDVDLFINSYNRVCGEKITPINFIEKYLDNTYEYNKIYKFKDFRMKKQQHIEFFSITIKLDVLKLVDEKITEKMLYVDNEFNFFSTMYVKNIVILKEKVYQYRISNNGNATSGMSSYKHYNEALWVVKRIIDLYYRLDNNLYNNKNIITNKIYLWNVVNAYYKNLHAGLLYMPRIDRYKDLKLLKKEISELYPQYANKFNLGIYKILSINYYFFLNLGKVLKKIQILIKGKY